ncbi:MAG: ribosomal protein S18-alanine N-acetyltransferase [Candidatus Heimdallarchaeaceae archaeon]
MNNIRQMTKDDIPHVYEIERKSFPYPFGEVLIGSLYFGAPELCYVLEQNGKIIGFLLGGYTPTPRQAHILSFAILESFRGEGLGKELFIHLLNQLENLEFDSVKLEVNVDNQRAIELYESLQFKIESRIRKYYQDNSDAFTMVRRVD